ncbi:hypothetical protein FRX31_034777 [Thalictrum thalictroides]|uniref:Uncharacterized protein n=1 Tax=Thalictrum thalictroides TaxID=46969 RepID=A0A7J6UTP5_THATH|nr:hypothetical protein FRX31_034777 [Thalictrum thalictroides]
MRHQYLGVKQKIRVSDDEFNWSDGQDHWTNFFKYKEVFGDVELDAVGGMSKRGIGSGGGGLLEEDGCYSFGGNGNGNGNDVLGLGLDLDCEDFDDGCDGNDDADEGLGFSDGEEEGGEENFGSIRGKRLKRDDGIGFLGSQVLELRDVMCRKEERRREREFRKEEEEMSRYERKWERENQNEERLREREERMEAREFELEERQKVWERRECERRIKVEREFEEDRRRFLMKMEEKREEEEMAWRERMVAMQIEHEKQMIQMHCDACQNQMQVLGVLVRLMCQFFGSGNDALGGLGPLPPQVLHSLQQQGGLVGDNVKPDLNSDSHFM